MGEDRLRGVSMSRALSAIGIENDKLSSEPVGLDAAPKDLGVISPFGHFLLIHAILAMLCHLCKSSTPNVPSSTDSGNGNGEVGTDTGSTTAPVGEEVNENVYVVQLALHRWLRIWLENPEAHRSSLLSSINTTDTNTTTSLAGSASQGRKGAGALYFADPLPFYWLAQLLLLAFQEQLPPFAPKKKEGFPRPPPFRISAFCVGVSGPPPSTHHDEPPATSSRGHASPEFVSPAYYRAPTMASQMVTDSPSQTATALSQFTLVKCWLHHVRLFLKKSEGSATVVWDELMRIRLNGWEAVKGPNAVGNEEGRGEGTGTYYEQGLLGFFEEVDQKLKI